MVPRALVPQAVRVVKPVVVGRCSYRAIPLLQPWVMAVRKVVGAVTLATPWDRAMIRQTPWEVVTPDRIPKQAVRALKILTLKVGTPRIPWVAAILDKTPTARVGLLPQEMAVVEPVKVLWTSRFPELPLVVVDQQDHQQDLQHRRASQGMGTQAPLVNPLSRKH